MKSAGGSHLDANADRNSIAHGGLVAARRERDGTGLLPASADAGPFSSADLAGRYIRRLIFDGYLTHGQRVPQDEIAQALGISRIPVREALIALSTRGWVSIEHNRGAFVNAFTDREVRDSYEL